MHSSVHDIRPCRCQSLVVHLGTSYGFVSDTCCDLLCRSTCIHLFILSVIRIGTVRLLFPLISRCSGSFSKSFSTSLRDVSSSVFGFAVHLGFYSFNRILETSPCHFLLKVITFANTTWSSAAYASALPICSSSTMVYLLPSLSRCSFNITTSRLALALKSGSNFL